MQVTSVALPEDLYRGLKYQAVYERITLRDLFEKALKRYLKEAKKEGGPRGYK